MAATTIYLPMSLMTTAALKISETAALRGRLQSMTPEEMHIYRQCLYYGDDTVRTRDFRFYYCADEDDGEHSLTEHYDVVLTFVPNDCLRMTLEQQIETLYDIIQEMALDFDLNDDYPEPICKTVYASPEFLPLVLNLTDWRCDHSLASWRRSLLLRAGIESNPGPASVDFVNLASRNFLLQDQTISQCAQENDGKLTWFVQIILNKYPSLSSVTFSHYNKKIAYEMCYEQIMAKINAKMTNNCFDLEPEMKQAFNKRRVNDAVHESELPTEGSHGETTSETMSALQTNLVTTTEESSGTPTAAKVFEQDKTTTENIGNYENLTTQWYLIDEFEWGVTTPTLIREYVLPRDILASNIAANSPPLIPFNVNYLWRGSLEVRIQTKAQMFLTGQLQISSFYELDVDADARMRRNVYAASQTNHVLVNAGGSNDAVLRIPYVYRQPFTQIKQDALMVGNNSCLDMVNVLIQVLNPLKVGSGSSDVSVAVFIRFVESGFTGKRDGAIGNFDGTSTLAITDARHEMFSFAADIASMAIPGVGGMIGTGIRMAERVLREKKRDKNRDNPPSVGPTDYLIPYSTQNWANGTNIAEPLRTLRLDPVGQTPHPDGQEQIDQMAQISQIFGLFRQIQWNENQSAGTTLMIVPCTPLMSASHYQLSSEDTANELRFVPPVGVVASMYNLFRGPLKFRLDVIANKFYLGGLIMGYVPGITETTIVTNEMLRNSAFTTYSLDANNLSITYETPFINGAEWYNTPFAKPYNNAYARLPGCFVINILQRLQQPEAVNSEVDINIYMAAGSGFECANLTQPSLVTPTDATFVLNPRLIFNPVNFPPPDFLGSRPDTGSGFGGLDPIALTLGGGSGIFAAWNIFSSAPSFIAFADPPFILTGSSGPQVFTYFLALRVSGTIRMYCIQQNIPSINTLISAINSIPYSDDAAARGTLAMITGPSPWFNLTGVGFAHTLPHLRAIWTQGQGPLITDIIDAEHESERDLEPNLVTSVQQYTTNNWGMDTFGECFGDVKDVLRRPIYNQDFAYVDSGANKFPHALFKMRVGPIPPQADLDDPFDLINRSSHTKIVLSGYRYYRGGMRYRILMPYLNGVYVWTQYDASDKIATDSLAYPVSGIATPVLTHSNPIDILTLQVNQIMNLEIPWYNSNQLNYLQRVNFTNLDADQINATSLGSITVGLSTNQTETIPGSYTINVYSKVADDFAPYVFQGFPPMAFQSFLNPTEPTIADAEHEMIRRNIIQPIIADVEVEIGKVAVDIRAQIGDVTNSIGDALNEIVEKIKKSAGINLDFNWNIVITDLVSQLGHCIMNPNLKTFIWSIITMLTKIGILSYNMIGKAVELFNNICNSVFGIYNRVTNRGPQQEPATGLNAEHNAPGLNPSQTLPLPLDDVLVNNTAEFWSLIVSSLAGLIGFGASAKYFNGRQFAWSFSRSLRDFTMTANGLTAFLKLHLDTIKKVLKSICFWKSVEEFDPESMIVYNKSFIETWCKEVSYLTAPGMDSRIVGDSYFSDRVYLCFMIGEVIAKNVISKTENKVNNSILTNKLAQIRKLHEQCIMAGKTGAVRRETFGVWLDGDAGIGKSYIVEEISTRLLLRGDIRFEGEKTLTLNAADKYWSRCNKQPVLWIDDVFQCQTEEMIQSHLNAIFSVMSPTPLCPPMADLKDKDRIYEPRILMMTANSAFPNVKQVGSKAALWRRRHALIKCRLDLEHCRAHDPDFHENKEVKDLPEECTANYQHLWFTFALSPKKRETRWTQAMKYDEAMLYLDAMWDRFEEQSLRSYNHRLNKYYEAKRQVLPDYLNSMPNVPKSSNLFDQIKELAARLDNSALSIDEIHWNDMMEAKREKWVDKVFNVPKRMLSVLVGRYPMFTYGVNSILTGTIPNRQGYNRYTAHGLGWDDPNHSDLCPAWDRPPLVTTVPRNGHGRRTLGTNPFSSENRRLVRQSKELRCFGLTREQVAQVDNAMGRDDVAAFVEELQVEQGLIDAMEEDDEEGIFDMRDVFHEGEDDVKDTIHKIGDTIRQYYLGQSDRLMLLLNHVCSFRRKLKHREFLETLDFFGTSLGTAEKRKVRLSVSNFVMLMYSKLAQYDVCDHFKMDKGFVYMREDCKFVKNPHEFDKTRECKNLSGGACDDHCPLGMKLFKEHIYGMVICPQGLPEDCTYGIDVEIQRLVVDDVETYKDKCLSKLKEWCSSLWTFMCEHYKSVIAALSVIVFTWYVWYKPDNTKGTVSEGAAYDKNKKMVEKRKITAKRKLIRHNQAKEKIIVGEHEANQNVGDVMRKLSQNVVFLKLDYTWEGMPKSKKYRAVMLRERQCLMIRHYIEDIQFYADHDSTSKLCMLVNGGHEVPLPIDCVNEFSVLDTQEEQDFDENREGTGYVLYNGLCVVDLPKTVRQFPTITHHFVTAKDELRMSNNGILLMPEPGKGSTPNTIVCENVKFNNYEGLTINAADTTSAVHLDRVWMYRGVHGYGVCGSLLLNEDSGKIIGIHTAGSASNNVGFSERLVYEEWEFVDEQAKLDVFVPNLEPITLDDHTLEGALFPLGKVPKMYAQQNSGESQIRKSVIHGVCEVKTEPAPLNPFDKRLPEGCSPLYDGVAVHGLPPKEFPPDLVDKARQDLRDLLLAKCIPVRPVQMLSMEEAVCGNPLIGLESIPLDTSEGFPLNKMRPRGCKGKGWLFNIRRDEHSQLVEMQIHPELEKIMKVKDAMRLKGIKPFTVFTDIIKDETLPKAKCRKKGGTRIISMSPVDFTIQSRQVFGDFILAHAKCRSDLEHSIGVNTYSDEWTSIAKEALRKGKKIVAGDHSKFGPRMMTIVSEAVFKCIRDWYEFHGATKEHLLRLDIMAAELMNSVHLCFDLLYQVMCGIVSGSLFTAVFNSLCDNVYFRVAWLELTGRSFEDFYQHMYFTTYGDDNFNSVSDAIAEEFNVATLHKFFAKYDLAYTDVHKNTSENMEKYCDLKDASFLKTGWKEHPFKAGYFLPTLEKDSIENQLNWITKEGDAVDNTITNCKSALRQAFGHGKEYYDELYNKIKTAFARQGHHFMHRTWEEQYVSIDADYHIVK